MNKEKILQLLRRACPSFAINCLLCLEPASNEVALCHACQANLPWLTSHCIVCCKPLPEIAHLTRCQTCFIKPPPYEVLQALFHYQAPITHFINQLKFQQRLYFAQLLGYLMSKRLQPKTRPTCIVPMPLFKMRQQQRGFNQSLEIARPIARQLNLPLITQHCLRIQQTLVQTGLETQVRKLNVTTAHFKTANLQGARVLLIDDFMMTGATIKSATQSLLMARVASVEVWVAARH